MLRRASRQCHRGCHSHCRITWPFPDGAAIYTVQAFPALTADAGWYQVCTGQGWSEQDPAHLVALGKHRVLVDVADEVGDCCPDAKAYAKDEEVGRNESVDGECARPASDPPAPGLQHLAHTALHAALSSL